MNLNEELGVALIRYKEPIENTKIAQVLLLLDSKFINTIPDDVMNELIKGLNQDLDTLKQKLKKAPEGTFSVDVYSYQITTYEDVLKKLQREFGARQNSHLK